jgi:hypothetical protein
MGVFVGAMLCGASLGAAYWVLACCALACAVAVQGIRWGSP